MTEKTKRRSRTAGVLLILAVLLLVLIWLDINAGYQQITLTQLWQIICGKGEKGVTYTLVNLRLHGDNRISLLHRSSAAQEPAVAVPVSAGTAFPTVYPCNHQESPYNPLLPASHRNPTQTD